MAAAKVEVVGTAQTTMIVAFSSAVHAAAADQFARDRGILIRRYRVREVSAPAATLLTVFIPVERR